MCHKNIENGEDIFPAKPSKAFEACVSRICIIIFNPSHHIKEGHVNRENSMISQWEQILGRLSDIHWANYLAKVHACCVAVLLILDIVLDAVLFLLMSIFFSNRCNASAPSSDCQ